MMEACTLFLFILIDFSQQTDKKTDIIMSEFVTNIKECERMGLPKTYIIGVFLFLIKRI